MDGYVAHPAHFRPWKLGMLCDEARRGAVDLVNGLADDLYVAQPRPEPADSVERLGGLVRAEGSLSPGQSLPQCVPDILRRAPDAS